jgi:hypothetical protein
MKLRLLVFMTVAVAICGSVARVRADDIFPPPWLRLGPETTYQNWTYGTNANPAAPDVAVYNPYGTPIATITDGNWLAVEDNHVGVWQLLNPDSSINSVIPVYPTATTTAVWTQITWSPEDGVPDLTVDGDAGTLLQRVQLTAQYGPNSPWYQDVWETTVPTLPSVSVLVTGGVDVGEVVVDTIPEPSTLALLAMGVFGLLAYTCQKRQA